VKFTHSGHILIAVEPAFPDASTPQLTVSVIDTGIGVPEDKIPSLFQKFSQADSSTTRRYGGTGLGLAISKQLVELMGGSIGVESRLGEGSKFWFKVPLLLDPERATATPQSCPRSSWAGRFAGLALRVLVVEDNVINQKVAFRLLEKLGLRADLAANGREAVEMAAASCYDVVFMDCQMPVMNGYEAAAEIRRRESARHATIIAMTAEATVRCREECLRAGMDSFIAKPVKLDDIVDALKNCGDAARASLA